MIRDFIIFGLQIIFTIYTYEFKSKLKEKLKPSTA